MGCWTRGCGYWRCTPSRPRHSGRGFRAVDGSVVSLIEPQHPDHDVALPHVTNQIPIGPTRGRFDRHCGLSISVLLSRVVAAGRPHHRPRPRTGTMTPELSAGGG
jgi:hypothetical protein